MNKFIIGVTLIGVILVIAIFISSTIQDATYEDAFGTSINETLDSVDNITTTSFAYSTLTDASCGAVTNVIGEDNE